MPATRICPQDPPDDLKKRIRGSRRALSDITGFMWSNGWKERIYPSGVGVGWQKFLSIVKENWFRFEMWSVGDQAWEELERQILEEIHRIAPSV